MACLTSRRLLKGLAVLLLGTQVGCAARGVHVSAAEPPPSLSAEERQACAAFAKREAKAVKTRSVAEASAEGFAYGLLAGVFLMPGAAPMLAPMGAMMKAVDQTKINAAARRRAYASAEGTCLEPAILAETLGPDHPDVAAALRRLAGGYASQQDYVAAESLYRRALDIQERALGPGSEEVASTLDAYANLLRATNREPQAIDVKSRADAIRHDAQQRREIEAAAATGVAPETAEWLAASAPMPWPAADGQ